MDLHSYHGKNSSFLPTNSSREPFFEKEGVTVWNLIVWQPGGWHRAYNHPTSGYRMRPEFHGKGVPAPQINLYLGTGVVDWKKIRVPKNITLVDKRVESAPFKPEKGAMLYGEVNDMATGRPIAGTKVWIREYDRETKQYVDKKPATKTNEMGEYHFEVVLPSAYYEICFSKAGYAGRTEGCRLSGERQAEERRAELIGESSIQGVVEDTAGNPVPGIRVEVRSLLGLDGRPYRRLGYNPIKPSAITNAEGRFEIDSLPQGYTHLYAKQPGLHMKSTNILYKIPAEFERGDSNSKEPKIVLEGTGDIRGKVVEVGDKANGRQVHINLEPLDEGNTWGGAARCKEDGGFAFNGVPHGRYKLSTQAMLPGMGDDPNAKEVVVSVGASVNAEIKYSTGRDLVREK